MAESTALTVYTGLFYCQQADELLEAMAESIRQLMTLHGDQFRALIGGDLDSERFDDLIHMANERKREAKYAYLAHLEVHGCSRIVPEELCSAGDTKLAT